MAISLVAHVRQQDTFGCVIACCAMVAGVSYEDAASVLGPARQGFSHHTWQEYLARYGFASMLMYRHDCIAKADRSPWPMPPWAEVHLCSVDAGHGAGTHLVVMLKDGVVLDPMSDAPRRIEEFSGIAYMAAVYRVTGP